MHNIGIWIDSQKAVIISPDNSDGDVKKIFSSHESKQRIEGQGDDQSRFGSQYISDEKSKKERKEHDVKRYLEEIIDEVKDTGKVVVFGPALMKTELKKAIDKKREMSGKLIGIEVADNMTEKQMVAWVKDYFEQELKSE